MSSFCVVVRGQISSNPGALSFWGFLITSVTSTSEVDKVTPELLSSVYSVSVSVQLSSSVQVVYYGTFSSISCGSLTQCMCIGRSGICFSFFLKGTGRCGPTIGLGLRLESSWNWISGGKWMTVSSKTVNVTPQTPNKE